MLDNILRSYNLDAHTTQVVSVSTGLINQTWKIVTNAGVEYILQRINRHAFRNPWLLSENLDKISAYLNLHHPEYQLVVPLTNNTQQALTTFEGEYFRLSPYIRDSVTIERVTHPEQAYEAALQFGRFVNVLSDFDASALHPIIPGFHDLSSRYQQFEEAVKNGDALRIKHSSETIKKLNAFAFLVSDFEKLTKHAGFKRRVMHHDTKISNVLFDDRGRGKCVIDLDTVMEGYFVSDVGDMIRTYISPTTEEELNSKLIEIRDEVFDGIVGGYMETLGDQLTSLEKEYFIHAGFFLTYMQALRFMTDFLNRDIYYGAKREFHNFDRANNQLALLQALEAEEPVLRKILKRHAG